MGSIMCCCRRRRLDWPVEAHDDSDNDDGNGMPGPLVAEPQEAQWVDEVHGLACPSIGRSDMAWRRRGCPTTWSGDWDGGADGNVNVINNVD